MRCIECGAQMRLTTAPITERYKGVDITAPGIEHFVCDRCGEYELGPDAADKLSAQLVEGYARARGLMTPSEIKEARKRLKMTQVQFEAALGVTSPTASRWETGAISPSKTVCKLILLLLERDNESAGNRGRTRQSAQQGVAAPAHAKWKVHEGGSSSRQFGMYRTQRPAITHIDCPDEAKEG